MWPRSFAIIGRLCPRARAANPRTGERIAIGPSSGVSFKAGRALRDALNGRRPSSGNRMR